MTNQFTDEQVEAAAKVLWERHALNGEWDAGSDTGRDECRDDARAALEAAAGVDPQAPSECDCGAGPGSATCKRWCATRSAPVQPSGKVQDSPEIENLGGEISIPVQPSSTVDEAWLTDVIWARATRKTALGFSINSREGAAVIARAVVEAIGGEGRGHN